MAENLAKSTTPTRNNLLITSEMMVSLINLSGRQRMLSQRVALNVALAANGNSAGLNEAKEALALFKHTHTILVHGSHEYPGLFFPELEKAFFGQDQNEAKINAFILLAEQAISKCEQSNSDLALIVNELGEAANRIVSVLNTITVTYESKSKLRAANRHKHHTELMSNIQKIAKEAKITSFNAQVIAARAGEAGKEFAVVASVMTNITEKIDQLAIAALNND